MSVRVLTKVFSDSEATLATRLVLLALADAAHDDGVTWILQERLADKAKVSKATVARALDELESLGEIERRKAQRGRRRIAVYHVTLADVPIDYDALPFTLTAPFATTSHSETSSTSDDLSSTGPTTSHSERSLARAGEGVNLNVNGTVIGDANASPAQRPRNVVYDALAAACAIRPELLSSESPIFDRDLAREIGVAQAAIRKKAQGLPDDRLAEEVALRADAYRERWPEIDLTPSALAKHWNRVVGPSPRRGLTAREIAGSDDIFDLGEDRWAR